MRRRRNATADLWLASAKAGMDTWVTLSRRVPMLLTGQATEREKRRMVAEKVDASVDATVAAARTMQAMLARKPATDPMTALGRAAEVALAASKPFHTRVASNAARLGRGPKKRARSG